MQRDPIVARVSELLKLEKMLTKSEIKAGKVRSVARRQSFAMPVLMAQFYRARWMFPSRRMRALRRLPLLRFLTHVYSRFVLPWYHIVLRDRRHEKPPRKKDTRLFGRGLRRRSR